MKQKSKLIDDALVPDYEGYFDVVRLLMLCNEFNGCIDVPDTIKEYHEFYAISDGLAIVF